MEEYISRKEAFEYIDFALKQDLPDQIKDGLRLAKVGIKKVPTAKVFDEETAEWIPFVDEVGFGECIIHYHCSCCGIYSLKELKYCPNCGKKMRKWRDENDGDETTN